MDFYRMKREAFKLIDLMQQKNLPEIEIISTVQTRFGFGKKIVLDRLQLNNELAKRQMRLQNGVSQPKN